MSTKENKVCLYIFTHNKTGLKYFGKTINSFTEEELLKYGGSGIYWKNHIKKHGKDLSVEIYGIYNIDKVKEIAINFSKENDIVKATNENGKKIWANLEIEDGLNGGLPSQKNKIAISKANRGKTCYKNKNGEVLKLKNNDPKVLSGEYIGICNGIKYKKDDEKYISRRGNKPHNALDIDIYDNNDKLVHICNGNFKQICEDNNLPFKALTKSYKNKGLPIFGSDRSYKRTKEEYKQYKGWYALKKGINNEI